MRGEEKLKITYHELPRILAGVCKTAVQVENLKGGGGGETGRGST